MNKFLSGVAFACLSLTACQNAPVEEGALVGARIGGPFTLTDQDGKSVNWDSFKGRYRLVYFGYTYCPDVCPVDLQSIMAGYRLLAKQHPDKASKVQPIFISIDPERDTPAVLKTYVAAFPPNLIGLTGSVDAIARVTKDFAVVYGKEEGSDPKAYLVSHSRTPYLFGPDGKPIDLIPVDDPATKDNEGMPQSVADLLAHRIS